MLVSVSNTLFRKLVRKGARCSYCGLPVSIHGGYVPCGVKGAVAIVATETIKAVVERKEINHA